MAARKKNPAEVTISFKINDIQYRIMPGKSRDFLSAKGKEGPWEIMDDGATAAVLDAMEKQIGRLKSE